MWLSDWRVERFQFSAFVKGHQARLSKLPGDSRIFRTDWRKLSSLTSLRKTLISRWSPFSLVTLFIQTAEKQERNEWIRLVFRDINDVMDARDARFEVPFCSRRSDRMRLGECVRLLPKGGWAFSRTLFLKRWHSSPGGCVDRIFRKHGSHYRDWAEAIEKWVESYFVPQVYFACLFL